ncbi:uncharacterized protein [Dermacentor albipictus]|uniref:uncharacterized protein n=1 Tax=Dermacentor albipictus TaxID=60249 RepID=UPI0038FCC5F6
MAVCPNFVRTLAKHLDIDVKFKNLDYSKKEQFSEEYLNRPLVHQKTKPTAEELSAFEENVIRGLEHLIGDNKFAVGDNFTLADIALTARIIVALENKFVDPAKFPKLASYYDRVKRQQSYFEKIYRPVINSMEQLFDSLK